jgi:hypothetical protein
MEPDPTLTWSPAWCQRVPAGAIILGRYCPEERVLALQRHRCRRAKTHEGLLLLWATVPSSRGRVERVPLARWSSVWRELGASAGSRPGCPVGGLGRDWSPPIGIEPADVDQHGY